MDGKIMERGWAAILGTIILPHIILPSRFEEGWGRCW